MYATLTLELFMNKTQLEAILGTRLSSFKDKNEKTFAVGFIRMPGTNYRHADVKMCIDELNGNANPIFFLGTQSQAAEIMKTFPFIDVPKYWCVPTPECGKILLCAEGELVVLEISHGDINWQTDFRVLISIPVTEPIRSHSSK